MLAITRRVPIGPAAGAGGFRDTPLSSPIVAIVRGSDAPSPCLHAGYIYNIYKGLFLVRREDAGTDTQSRGCRDNSDNSPRHRPNCHSRTGGSEASRPCPQPPRSKQAMPPRSRTMARPRFARRRDFRDTPRSCHRSSPIRPVVTSCPSRGRSEYKNREGERLKHLFCLTRARDNL